MSMKRDKINHFKKWFGRTHSREGENYLEYRSIRELDIVIDSVQTKLKELELSHEIKKMPQLNGFRIYFNGK